MTQEEIIKKAYEAYPKWCEMGEYDMNEDERNGYIKALTEVDSLPKIKGWVARNKTGELCLFNNKPEYKLAVGWVDEHHHWRVINPNFFPNLRWEDEPIEVELLIQKI